MPNPNPNPAVRSLDQIRYNSPYPEPTPILQERRLQRLQDAEDRKGRLAEEMAIQVRLMVRVKCMY